MIVTLILVELAAFGAPFDLQPELGVVVRAVGETWPDEGIGSVYATGALAGGAALLVEPFSWLGADMEFAYRRLSPANEGREGRLELVPLSLVVEARYVSPRGVTGFAGLGPALTLFTDRNPSGHGNAASWTDATLANPVQTVLTGGRLAVEVRTGLRMDTGLVRPPRPPARSGPVQALDVELYVARRFQNPGRKAGEGFNLSAWRAALGLILWL